MNQDMIGDARIDTSRQAFRSGRVVLAADGTLTVETPHGAVTLVSTSDGTTAYVSPDARVIFLQTQSGPPAENGEAVRGGSRLT